MKTSAREQFWYGFNISALILSCFFILFVPVVQGFQDFTKTVDIFLTQTHAGTGDVQTFTVEIDNASSTPLNAIEFELSFNPQEMHITDIVQTAALCEERFILTKQIDNTNGNLLFQCGTVTPYSRATGTIATVYAYITVPRPNIRFGTTTHVLAYDGYGTDATRTILVKY